MSLWVNYYNLPRASTKQSALFRHGSGSHDVGTSWHVRPMKPGAHIHSQPAFVSTHKPKIKQHIKRHELMDPFNWSNSLMSHPNILSLFMFLGTCQFVIFVGFLLLTHVRNDFKMQPAVDPQFRMVSDGSRRLSLFRTTHMVPTTQNHRSTGGWVLKSSLM